jgi:hypothetical protein
MARRNTQGEDIHIEPGMWTKTRKTAQVGLQVINTRFFRYT